MEIFEALIEELNQAVLTAKKAPLSSQDIVVNRQKMWKVQSKFSCSYQRSKFNSAWKRLYKAVRRNICKSVNEWSWEQGTANDLTNWHSSKSSRTSE